MKTLVSSVPLLAHLANLLTDQRELLLTQALGHILRGSAQSRSALTALILQCTSAELKIGDIQNEESFGDSRPDLVLYDESGALVAFVEAKIWAGLTDAQPLLYLKRLHESQGKVLLMVVPGKRIPSLVGEVSDRVMMDSQSKLEWAIDDRAAVARHESQHIIITSWTYLIGMLESFVDRSHEPNLTADIIQLRGLVNSFEVDGYIPLSARELSDIDVPRTVLNLRDVVLKALEKAIVDKVVSVKGLLPRSMGRYVRLKKVVCWIGLDLEAWEAHGTSPLWLIVYRDSKNGRTKEIRIRFKHWLAGPSPRMFITEEDAVNIPLRVPAGAGESKVIDSIVEQIRNIDHEFEKINLPDLVAGVD